MNYGCVIVTFNRKKLLLESLDALMNQTIKPKKIVVFDNHSTDETQMAVSKKYDINNNDIIEYVYATKNLGGSAGYYYGIKKMLEFQIDWISLSDDDAIYSSNFFQIIEKQINYNANVMAFSGTVRLNDKRNSIQYVHRKHLKNMKNFSVKKSNEAEYKKDVFEVDEATFVGLVIKTDLIRKIGLPHKRYFIWNDDAEYSLRIRKYSKIINCNKAIVVHKTKLIPGVITTWKDYYGFRNYILLLDEHSDARFTKKIYPFYKFVRYELSNLKPKYKGYRNYRLKMYFDAYIDGLKKKDGFNEKYGPTNNTTKKESV